MAKQTETLWKIEPHTLAKHDILRRYLGAWFPIMAKFNKRLVYLDGFCGPGRYAGGEDGSPIIAIKEALKHSERLNNRELTFLFIDNCKSRIEHLKDELAAMELPNNFKVFPWLNEFELASRYTLDELEQKGLNLAPTFAFIDPFGFKGIPFELVSRLLNNPKSEIFINVMIDYINRFVEHPDPGTRRHIIDLFATRKVLDAIKSEGDRISSLLLLYQKQLKRHARFVRFFEMKDDRNKILYYLFFASNHPLGHAKMKEAFWKVDPTSGFRFSDATDPNQLVLFDLDPTQDLAKALQEKYADRTVQVVEVRGFVEDETTYTASHMRQALNLLETEKLVHVNEYKADGKKRRKGTFPDEAIVQFK
jgi:three-Cys-motif partner protein